MQPDKHISPLVWLIPTGLLILAVFPLPYAYYNFLRILVCVACTFLAYKEVTARQGRSTWVITLAAVALIFNPLIPIHLSRALWFYIDLAAAGLLLLHLNGRATALADKADIANSLADQKIRDTAGKWAIRRLGFLGVADNIAGQGYDVKYTDPAECEKLLSKMSEAMDVVMNEPRVLENAGNQDALNEYVLEFENDPYMAAAIDIAVAIQMLDEFCRIVIKYPEDSAWKPSAFKNIMACLENLDRLYGCTPQDSLDSPRPSIEVLLNFQNIKEYFEKHTFGDRVPDFWPKD